MGQITTTHPHQPPADRDTFVRGHVARALAHYQAVAAFEAAGRPQRHRLLRRALLLAAGLAALASLSACGGGTDDPCADLSAATFGPPPATVGGPVIQLPPGCTLATPQAVDAAAGSGPAASAPGNDGGA